MIFKLNTYPTSDSKTKHTYNEGIAVKNGGRWLTSQLFLGNEFYSNDNL